MNRYLIATTTPDYLPRTRAWFSSVALIRSARVCVVLVNFTEETDPGGEKERRLREAMPWIDFRRMPLPRTHSFNMVQAEFIDAFPDVADDDLVILTDMDAFWQRDFTEEEWSVLEQYDAWKYDHDVIWAWWNSGERDTLALEAERIGLSADWLKDYDPDDQSKSIPCMNCGFMVASSGLFRRVRDKYVEHCHEFYRHTNHRSRCQYLLQWVWAVLGLNVRLLLPSIHLHMHFSDTQGNYYNAVPVENRMGIFTLADGNPIVFRHHWQGDV